MQCRSLFIPAEVALELKYPPSYCKKLMEQHDDDRQVEGDNEGTGKLSDILPSSDDRTTGSFSIDKNGILITAGTPWWLSDRSGL